MAPILLFKGGRKVPETILNMSSIFKTTHFYPKNWFARSKWKYTSFKKKNTFFAEWFAQDSALNFEYLNTIIWKKIKLWMQNKI